MVTFYMMQGLAGSGKSFIAQRITEETGADIVSSDAMRKELFGDEDERGRNAELFDEAYKRIRASLREGKDVILDATNLVKKRRISLPKSLPECRKVNVCVMTPYEDCLLQNSQRERCVDEDVIKADVSHVVPAT